MDSQALDLPSRFVRLQDENANLKEQLAEAKKELKLWKPMTIEEAEAAYQAAVRKPISDEDIDAIIQKVTDPAYRPTEPEHVMMSAKIEQQMKQLATLREQLRIAETALETCMLHSCPCGGAASKALDKMRKVGE